MSSEVAPLPDEPRTGRADVPAPVADVIAPGIVPPPVPEQSASHVNAAKLASEKVVVAAPLSYAGSAARIWKLTGITAQAAGRIALGLVAIVLILFAWMAVTAWYFVFGLWLVPYRVVRRGQRKRKREALQHRELLNAIGERDRARV